MPQTTFDIWDTAQLTHMVERRLTVGKENTPSLGDRLAPFVDVQSRKVKYRVAEVDAFGIGKLRAPDGNPQLYRSSMTYTDQLVELALPDEMERIDEDTMLRLNSSDENIRRSAGADVITRGSILALRNYRKIEAMRWEMFLTGKVTLDYDDSNVQIDFGLPADHQVIPTIAWTNTQAANIVDQVRAWQKKVADDVGHLALHIYMNSTTWEYVYNNKGIRDLLSTWGRSLMVPTREEVARLFHEGTTIEIYDGGYRPEGAVGRGDSSLTKWLPDGYVLMTTDHIIDGQRIADTPNGQVLVSTGYNSAEPRQGPASETILHPVSHNTFLRYARAAIPRMLVPEAFFVADVYQGVEEPPGSEEGGNGGSGQS